MPNIEDGRVAALEQIAVSAKNLLEVEDEFILWETEEGVSTSISVRVHEARVALARDLAALGDFADA